MFFIPEQIKFILPDIRQTIIRFYGENILLHLQFQFQVDFQGTEPLVMILNFTNQQCWVHRKLTCNASRLAKKTKKKFTAMTV